MRVDEVKDTIKKNFPCERLFERSKDGLLVCPYCGALKVKYHQRTNTFYCTSCRRKGDAITIWRRRAKVSFPDAISAMAARLGLTIELPRGWHEDGTLDWNAEIGVFYD